MRPGGRQKPFEGLRIIGDDSRASPRQTSIGQQTRPGHDTVRHRAAQHLHVQNPRRPLHGIFLGEEGIGPLPGDPSSEEDDPPMSQCHEMSQGALRHLPEVNVDARRPGRA